LALSTLRKINPFGKEVSQLEQYHYPPGESIPYVQGEFSRRAWDRLFAPADEPCRPWRHHLSDDETPSVRQDHSIHTASDATFAAAAGAPKVAPPRADYFELPGMAPGFIIRHINGENTFLPRNNTKRWPKQDRKDYLKQAALASRETTGLKTRVEILATDSIVKCRTANSKAQGSWCGGQRGTIKEFTEQSCRNMMQTARNVEGLKNMLTLTYPSEFPCDGRLVKGHLELMRKWLMYRNIGAFWFLEFQRRGAPHFHMFITGNVDKDEVSKAWFRIVASGDEKHLRAGTRIEAIRKPHAVSAYAAKYAAKVEQKEVPDGYREVGRFWGTFGGVKVVPQYEESGTPSQVAPLVRVLRNLQKSQLRRKGLQAFKRRGKVRVGFTAYNTGPVMKRYLHWYLAQPAPGAPF